MPGTPSDRIDTLRERIQTSQKIEDVDREVLTKFSDELALLRSE